MNATENTSSLLKKAKANLYNILLTSSVIILVSVFFGAALLSQ